MILDPSEFVDAQSNFSTDNIDGEMRLKTTNNYKNSTAIIDYVEWGFTNHTRSSVAVAAVIWITGDFVLAFAKTMGLLYDRTFSSFVHYLIRPLTFE